MSTLTISQVHYSHAIRLDGSAIFHLLHLSVPNYRYSLTLPRLQFIFPPSRASNLLLCVINFSVVPLVVATEVVVK